MSSRYIENEIRDFGANPKKARKGKARKGNGVEDAILHSALRLSLQRILRETPPSELVKSRDFSVYTGTAGYCLLFLLLHSRGIGFGASGRMGQLGGYASPMELAAAYLDAAQASLERQEAKKGAGTQGFTFLTGAAGVHAVGAAVAQRAGDAARCRHHAREVASMEERAMAQQDHRSHEVMYGLAGYLNALLFIRANTREEIGEEEVPDPLILRVVDRIISDGAEFPAEGRWGSPGSPNSPSQLETSTAEAENSGENGDDRSRSDDSNEGGTGAEGDRVAGGDAPPREGKANGAGDGGARADQWGEVDPDAGEWEDPNRRRSSSGGGPGRSSGGRGRRGRRRKGSSNSSGLDGAGAAAAKAAVTSEASEAAAAAAAAAAATVAADAGEGYGGVLTYEWHSKMYLGAAHGVSGILFVLMQALQTVYGESLLMEAGGDGAGRQDLPPQAAEQLYLIRSTVDAILETSLPEGNFPSRPGSRDDRLVQWCHGAPGVIPTLTKAYEVFEDERYLEAARHSSDVVWRRGLLTKGNGLCHGVAGNGYAFLSLRKTDASDGRHLHRARSFAGFTASAVLGPNPTAGENAFRGDPFGPGAHAHSRSSGGVGGLGRSSSHDSGNSLPSLGWPSSAIGKSASAVAPSVVAAAAAATAVTAAAVSNGCGVGLRSSSASSLSTTAGSSMLTGASWHDLPAQAVPDRPMSLFEGLAGAATFLADMVPEAGAGEHAWFPSFELFP